MTEEMSAYHQSHDGESMIIDGATATIGDFFDHDPNNQEKIEVSFSCCRLSRRSCGRNYTWIIIEKIKSQIPSFWGIVKANQRTEFQIIMIFILYSSMPFQIFQIVSFI